MLSPKTIPELDATGLRKFAFTTAAILVLLFALLIPWLFNLSFPLWPWIIAGILAVCGAIRPNSLNPVYKLWMKFGLLMSKITTPLILGIVYFLILTPIAFFMRLSGRDSLKIKLDEHSTTYRIESQTPDYKRKMELPY